jgi:hypothetical protein
MPQIGPAANARSGNLELIESSPAESTKPKFAQLIKTARLLNLLTIAPHRVEPMSELFRLK